MLQVKSERDERRRDDRIKLIAPLLLVGRPLGKAMGQGRAASHLEVRRTVRQVSDQRPRLGGPRELRTLPWGVGVVTLSRT